MATERQPTERQPTDSRVRETYEEFQLGNETVGLIADPENLHAWIQSTVTDSVEP